MERLLKRIQRHGYRYAWLGIFSLTILFLLSGSYFRWFDLYEFPTLDFRFRLRPAIARTDQVALIEIGDDTIRQLGQYPIDRSNHAVLIKALAEAGAKAIVFDIFFSDPSPADEELAEAIRSAGNVYIPHVFDISSQKKQGKSVSAARYAAQSLPTFTEYARGTGHINIIPDPDGKYRRVPLYIEHDGVRYPYLSFLVGCQLLGIPFEKLTIRPEESISYGKDLLWPLDEHSMAVINFSGKWTESYAHYSYVDVLRSYIAAISGQPPVLDLTVFKDKICIIGLSAEGTADLHPNPFESLYPSVGIHAEIINSMVHKAFLARLSRAWNLGILVFLIALASWIVWRSRPLKAFLLVTAVIVAGTLLSFLVFIGWGMWADLFYPVMAVLVVYTLNSIWQAALELKKRLILENELKIARQIQLSFLPKAIPQVERLEITARMLTAHEVGGDLYDCFTFDDGRLAVMVGDVTGKGIPASLFMAMAVGAFRFFAVAGTTPERTLRQLNEKLMRDGPPGLFVTLFYAVFDTRKGTLVYANGGHLPLLHVPKERPSQFLDVEEGMPLGMIEGEYSGGKAAFSTGDIFVLYTDGITEARNAKEEMYGKERLKALVEQNRQRPVADLVRIIEEDVRRFEPLARQHDDMTYIVLKVVQPGDPA